MSEKINRSEIKIPFTNNERNGFISITEARKLRKLDGDDAKARWSVKKKCIYRLMKAAEFRGDTEYVERYKKMMESED